MDEKLRILMQSENLTASKLAEILEVKPAAVSHILSGRNKPSFELLCKIVNRFPQINPYWLLGDDPQMRNNSSKAAPVAEPSATSGTLFDMAEKPSTQSAISDIDINADTLPKITHHSAEIKKIIVVYDDQTFEELRPKR